MRIPVVRHWDHTTTGGRVIATVAKIHDKGKKIALHLEHATCGNCEGTFPMFGTGEKMRDRGRHVVVDGDSVLCSCGKNRVIAGPDSRVFIHKTVEPKRNHDGARIEARSALREVYDEQFTLKGGDGQPLAGVRYRIVTNRGRIFSGVTNGRGETERIATDGMETLALQLEK
ncbi:PAAR domain-containing protein [Paraburkholderia sp. CNPSo 3076]|uniref:PAAR domain-containing protein n=1 Tax=Paraburkholderia sp. CNPSo 3076 TaxID=2940936 RepID=UPI002253B5C9|nr:PAAR domain-containing protein [Paraburkholderia sp. CNPSo 3076]MCX5538792.1 PAAR domain-containing protein [Paraburkholderia sp. CNPSo 3076]